MCFPKCHSPNACAEWSCLDSDNFILFLFPPLRAVSTLDTSLAAEMVAEGFVNRIFTIPFQVPVIYSRKIYTSIKTATLSVVALSAGVSGPAVAQVIRRQNEARLAILGAREKQIPGDGKMELA